MRSDEVGSAGLTYRPDIDGLRAIAVLSVVFYHFGIGGLKGGFVGVDVFFVISGYLITAIIHSEIKRGEFTLGRFYERRARRIFPALFVVLLATMIASLWILLPSDLAWLGKASIATILFVSNVLYLLKSGYFDANSDFNPLLHTWSLGVEEQFYLGLPLMMLLVGRFWARGLGKVFAICALVSFIACVVVQPLNFKATFFLSPFRAWELLLGSLLGIGAIPSIKYAAARNGIAIVALCSLVGAVALMGEGIDFPGWKVAIPVLATALLLHVGASGGSRVSAALSWKPLVFIGLISYSLYLWHWPLLVLAKYRAGMEPLSSAASLVLLVVTFLLAVASYYLVERPFRKSGRGSANITQPKVFLTSILAGAALVAIGLSLVSENGFPVRVAGVVAELDRARSAEIPFAKCHRVLPGKDTDCGIGTYGGQKRALIWGDSHALAWAPGLDEALKAHQWAGALAVEHACAPLIGLSNPRNRKCSGFNDGVVDWIEANRPDRVYLIAHWPAWSNSEGGYDLVDTASGSTGNEHIFAPALGRTIEGIRPYVKEIVVVGPTPGAVDALPYKLAMARWKRLAVPDEAPIQLYRDISENFWRAVQPYAADVVAFNPESWFCNLEHCRYIDDGRLLYRDSDHLSVAGALFAASQLEKARVVAGNPQ
ncbi:acyltransferase family protein [Luteimonas sp. MC1828]|uniref:acyltransferase family protein n=1 Tax=Luteimonas sp. MC1828 TaxID=2799787 RepID=UPI0018F1655B|nr:acyltransferase family protein [Luteimonas sp. MC1828]MBJ7574397.1 acyltransferase [Luteimonas sp. MC1828]